MDAPKLNEFYPRMTVRNKRDIVTVITYGDGVTSVTLQPRQTAQISTKGLTNLPNPRDVHLVSPTKAELIDLGILRVGEDS